MCTQKIVNTNYVVTACPSECAWRYSTGDVITLIVDDGTDMPWFKHADETKDQTRFAVCMDKVRLASLPEETLEEKISRLERELKAVKYEAKQEAKYLAKPWLRLKVGDLIKVTVKIAESNASVDLPVTAVESENYDGNWVVAVCVGNHSAMWLRTCDFRI